MLTHNLNGILEDKKYLLQELFLNGKLHINYKEIKVVNLVL